ncbi:cupin [Psychroflexus sp. CAK1W]|uniref:cupin domain-containing protein n=1 Tax=Psychroflexus curvus TaxID=2873595 RepID=UPI001CCFBDFA|nr:cupin domain-containing protein [Psychroflexus curvus]MBZ9627532.1 cupin [Psychroflexus curvus]
MTTANFNEDQIFSNKIVTKVILESEFSKEIRILLASGQVMKEHQSKFPIMIHLLDGAIDLGVERVSHKLKKGDIIALKANVPHDLSATKDSVIRLSLSKSDSVERVTTVAEDSEKREHKNI